MKEKKIKLDKLTDHINYCLIDDTIYFFTENYEIKERDLLKIAQKVVTTRDISEINITGKNIDKISKNYQDLGLTLAKYPINKLSTLYTRKKDKESYRCFAKMSREQLLQKFNLKTEANSNAGFVNNFLLLFGGIILLCYFCIQGAIYLVK